MTTNLCILITIQTTMERITNEFFCNFLWENQLKGTREDRLASLIEFVKFKKCDKKKLDNFLKLFDGKMKIVKNRIDKFREKYPEWLESEVDIEGSTSGAPRKKYEELGVKSKKARQVETLSTHSETEVSETFKELLKRKKQSTDAMRISDVLLTGSPKRLRRVVKSIATPTSASTITEEEAMAIILQLKLSRNKYLNLRSFLREKGFNEFPSYDAIWKKKKDIIPSPVNITSEKGSVGLSSLLENTASRIVSTFSNEELLKNNNCDAVLICKWGCDGLSALPEYKQTCRKDDPTVHKSVFMSSLVPLRLRAYSCEPSSSSSREGYKDLWTNSTPGSKIFCRPISFEYTKETKDKTKELVNSIKNEINNLEKITIERNGCYVNVSFQLQLTMIDGKVANAITDTKSYWECSLCGDKRSEFSDLWKERTINEEAASFGISPLHARIRFLEYFLHIAYDLKYSNTPESKPGTVRNNDLLHSMRESEKKRIQEEFKSQMGLQIDKPLIGHGNTNDGNTARKFFENYNTTSAITGIDKGLIRRVNILLNAINSTREINSKKFGLYAFETSKLIISLYQWRPMTPTVHKVLCHGQYIIENNILPLGELTEEAQEARNCDFKFIQIFHTRKCSRWSQNEDLMNNLLLSSDPVLSSLRKKWFKSKIFTSYNEEDSVDLNYLFDTSNINECFELIKKM